MLQLLRHQLILEAKLAQELGQVVQVHCRQLLAFSNTALSSISICATLKIMCLSYL